MAAISHHLKIWFIYKYKLHVWPIFYTIFRVKNYDYVINIEIKGHQMSLNVISRSQYHIRSRILIFEIIGPSNTCTLASWAPLNWKKCRPCREDLVTVQCALWHVYFDNPLIPTCKTPVGFFARGHSRSLGIVHTLYPNDHTPVNFSPTADFDHLNCTGHSTEDVYTSHDDLCPS